MIIKYFTIISLLLEINQRLMKRLPFVMLLLAALYGCNNDAVNDSSLQIAESDITTLDGSLLDCMLDSWEPIYLEDSESALTAYIHNVHSDDGLLYVPSWMIQREKA